MYGSLPAWIGSFFDKILDRDSSRPYGIDNFFYNKKME